MKTAILPVLFAIALAAPAGAQQTAFTYQGRLKNGGQPASGPHDFQFRVFDATSGGSQLGPTICLDNLPVAGGVFVATLDFGQQFAGPAPRYLEIQVRADNGLDCSSASGMILLGPRQQLTAAPSASHAIGAPKLNSPDGSHPNALFVDNAGRIGLGATAPQATVQIPTSGGGGLVIQGPGVGSTNSAWASFFDAAGTRIGYIGDGSGADSDVYLASDVGDIYLSPGATPALTVRSNGTVGIGTTAPIAALEVRGDVRLGANGQFLAAAGEESLRIIRGHIDANGAILSGSGFAVTQTGPGKYQVQFNTSFAGLPAVTATVESGLGFAMPMTEFAASSGFLLETYDRNSGNFVNRPVYFMAVGPR